MKSTPAPLGILVFAAGLWAACYHATELAGDPENAGTSGEMGTDELPYPGPCTESVDRDGDGRIDDLTVYSYDDQRRLVGKTADLGQDGSLEVRERVLYGGSGLASETEIDAGDDGSVDTRILHTWDERGLLAMDELDHEDDRIIDKRIIYRYNDSAQLLSKATDTGPHSPSESAWSFLYSEEGLLLVEAIDWDGDGKPDETREHDYSADRLTDEVSIERTWDEVPEALWRLTFDEQRNLLERVEDELVSTGLERQVLFDYSCWK